MNEKDGQIVHNIAFLSDLAVQQDGEYVKVANTLDENLRALDTAIQSGGQQTDYTVTCTESTPQGFAKSYTLSQCGQDIATINIPKDMVIESGSVVDITFAEGHLYDGQTDVTEIIKGTGGTATESDAGKYIKLVTANSNNTAIYVKVGDLVDIYTSGSQAGDMVVVNVNNGTHQISATLADGTITAAKLHSDVQASLAKADTALQEHQDITGKADKVENAVSGNFAALDANGNLVDSGAKASDFVTGNHTHTQLVNGDASLDLASTGTASVTIAGAGPAPEIATVTITAGTLSGTNMMTQTPFSIEIPAQTIQIPLTTAASDTWRGESDGEVGDIIATVERKKSDSASVSQQGILTVGQKPASTDQPNFECIMYTIDNTDYDNPVLAVHPMSQSMGTTFTGTVTYSQGLGDPTDITKTLAFMEDVTTAVNNKVATLDAQSTSTDGTNVQVKVTEVDGKITAVNITKDETYKKPTGGIPGSDIADKAITASKLDFLNGLIFEDEATSGGNVGKLYRMSVLDGRLMLAEYVEPIPVFPKYALITLGEHWGWDDETGGFIDKNNPCTNNDRVLVGIAADDRTITVLRSKLCSDVRFIPIAGDKDLNWDTLEVVDTQYTHNPLTYIVLGPSANPETGEWDSNELGITWSTDDEDSPYGPYDPEWDPEEKGYYFDYIDGESSPDFSPTMQVLTSAQAQELYNTMRR